ncbi:uncharacterized protein LOC133849723 [Drosophila sulfurigaster albostrigata]|uniref:uncharacterized protein LOC133849723 n=1 Tax=Drosophila sulfurigaster albostrigata TaxID=89887 RepID=UPI002D21DFED|nr:uncharacterized protein LOC133849723 [Drosophila sulfurigaster albostrigata]
MNTIILFVSLISAVAGNSVEINCQESKELESTCGNYCFKAIKPVLDHTKYLQSQTQHLNEPDNLKKLVDTWIEQKLDNLRAAAEADLLKHFKLQDEKVDQKLQNLQKLIEERKQKVGPSFQKIGSKYYYIEESEEINWMGAVNKCLTLGGHLISIENLDEFNAIKKEIAD